MITRALRWLSIAALAASATGLILYLGEVAPLQQSLLEEKARSVAHQVDSLIQIRASSLWAVTAHLDIENLRADGNIAQSLTALRQRHADFRSLEVLDDKGEILAMLGEIPLSQAGRRGALEDVTGLTSSQSRLREWFSDDPASDCLYVTTKHAGANGKMWFARARFSRNQLELSLASANQHGTAQLRPTSSSVATLPQAAAPSEPSASESGPTGAGKAKAARPIVEVPLLYPGWTVTMEQRRGAIPLASKLAVACGGLALMAIAAFLLFRYCLPRVQNNLRAALGYLTSAGSARSRVSPLPPPLSPAYAKEESGTGAMKKSATGSEGSNTILRGAYSDTSAPGASDSAAAGLTGFSSCATADDVATQPMTDEKSAANVASPEEVQPEAEQLQGRDLPETLEVTWFEPDLSGIPPIDRATPKPDRAHFLESAAPQTSMLVDEGAEQTPVPAREDTDQLEQENYPPGWTSARIAP